MLKRHLGISSLSNIDKFPELKQDLFSIYEMLDPSSKRLQGMLLYDRKKKYYYEAAFDTTIWWKRKNIAEMVLFTDENLNLIDDDPLYADFY